MASRPPRDRLLPSVRWGLTAALAYLVLFDQSDSTGPRELFFVGALLGSNLLAARLDRWLSPERAFVVLVGADSALVLLGLMLADSASQDLVVGYFICMLLASLADSEERLIVLSLVAVALYAMIGIRGGEDLWKPALLLRFPLLVFVTLSYGLLVARLRAERTARTAAERRAVNLEAVLALTRDLAGTLSTEVVLDRTRMAIARALRAVGVRIASPEDSDAASRALVSEAAAERAPLVRRRDEAIVVAIPLFHGAEALGAILADLDRKEPALSSEELEFCQIAADAASLALANARQFEALKHLERTKTDFLRNLSHEMHTPLHAILGFSDIAQTALEPLDRPGLEHALERIQSRAEEMSVHVEHLLHLSQLTLGRERAVPTVVDLPQILARSLEDARRLAPAERIDLELKMPPTLTRVIVDGEKLERIVECLLLNAVKFTERGKIELAASVESGNRLRLSVRDEGVGVPGTANARIFDDFQQADGSTTRRYPGLGLGLAVSRRLAELLGGEIKVASETGRGATFELVVPVGVPSAA
ncbi:MAG: sensor histidine kinase [Candidatus Binatia bacterium]